MGPSGSMGRRFTLHSACKTTCSPSFCTSALRCSWNVDGRSYSLASGPRAILAARGNVAQSAAPRRTRIPLKRIAKAPSRPVPDYIQFAAYDRSVGRCLPISVDIILLFCDAITGHVGHATSEFAEKPEGDRSVLYPLRGKVDGAKIKLRKSRAMKSLKNLPGHVLYLPVVITSRPEIYQRFLRVHPPCENSLTSSTYGITTLLYRFTDINIRYYCMGVQINILNNIDILQTNTAWAFKLIF